MANTIKIKNSGTTGTAPSTLEFGELGLNYADGKIFFKNLTNTIVEFSTPPNLVVQPTAPANTSVIWADTSVTGVGVVPTGGTTGQVLSKASNTNYDAAWANTVTSSDLALKANIASPTFTGTVTIPAGASISGFAPLANAALTGVPTAPTATAATNTTQIATTAFVRTEVANLVASAPAALDTLDELAAALGDDANFATTTATAIGLKAPLASPALTGTPTAPTASAGTNTTQIATMASKPWNTAWGQVAYAQRVSNLNVGADITEITSVTFTAVTGRRYSITGSSGLYKGGSANYVQLYVFKNGANSVRLEYIYSNPGLELGLNGTCFDSPSAGSVTYSLRVGFGSNTENLIVAGSNYPAFIQIQDIGPA